MKFKTLLPHLVALVVFVLALLVNFGPALLQNKAIGNQGDVINYEGTSQEFREYRDRTGERPNWTGTVFGGMPTYQLSNVTEGNQLKHLQKPLGLYIPNPAGYFLGGMVCFYLMFILLGVNPWLAILGALAGTFATNNIILFATGHVNKVRVVMFLPLVAAGILLAFRKRYLLGGLVFALGMGLSIYVNHPQMLYYFGLTLGFLGIAEFVRALRAGELVAFAKGAGVLIVGLILAVGAGAASLLTTQEYLGSSTRGRPVLTQPAEVLAGGAAETTTPVAPVGSSTEGPRAGLSWDYAMQWSNGFKDIVASYVPYAAGGGARETLANAEPVARALRQRGLRVGNDTPVPLYHGSLPFTEAPIYLGAAVIALFIFGLFTASTTLRIWMGLGTLFVLLLSAGANAEFVNRTLFDHLPMFNKFRTPNSALSVIALLMVGLGVFGLNRWYGLLTTDPERARKQLLYSGVVSLALGLFAALLLPSMLDFTTARDVELMSYGGQLPGQEFTGPLEDSRRSLYTSDAWRSLLYVGLTFGTLFLLFKRKINLAIGAGLLAIIAFVDFQGVNKRYLTDDDFVTRKAVGRRFQPTAADQQILQDPDPHYRVWNTTRRLDQDALTSYYHKSIGGYSAVKLRRYEDVISGYLSTGDRNIANALNVKYLIGQQGEQLGVQRNPDAFGNAWFVSNIEQVPDNDAEFRALGTTDLRQTAIVHQEYADAVAGLSPTGEGTIELTSYSPVELQFRADAPSEQLAVFSEVWYDEGWQVTVDGEPAELLRVNYFLRGLRVPPGQHEIVMTFSSASYATGYTVSMVCSILIILGLLAFGTYRFLQRDQVDNTVTPTAVL